jgi:hypothetical protein
VFRVHAGVVDYAILAVYFVVVLGIGFVARRQIRTGLDFFLSGRSLPAWITGLAFIAANLGALEINPIGADWVAIVFGLGFVLSFGYWTTNFAEVQRALAAKNLCAARRTPLIAAFPMLFIPFLVVVPGLIAAATVKGLGAKTGDLQYNNAVPS